VIASNTFIHMNVMYAGFAGAKTCGPKNLSQCRMAKKIRRIFPAFFGSPETTSLIEGAVNKCYK